MRSNLSLRRPYRRASMMAVLTAGAVLLGACGSATVENDDGPETLGRETTAESSTASSTSSASETSSTKDKDKDKDEDKDKDAQSSEPSQPVASGGAPAAEDRGAHEVDEVPQSNDFSGPDRDFLDGVGELGVNIDGAESQLVSAGRTICDEDPTVMTAVSGQLIAQDRTDMEFEELTDKLTQSARENYC